MKASEIKKLVKTLAQTQGYYALLLLAIERSNNEDEMWAHYEAQNFKDEIDFILFMEQ